MQVDRQARLAANIKHNDPVGGILAFNLGPGLVDDVADTADAHGTLQMLHMEDGPSLNQKPAHVDRQPPVTYQGTRSAATTWAGEQQKSILKIGVRSK